MTSTDRMKILLVDDRQDKLVALEAMLAELGEVVKAQSGQEALRYLLHQDFAVILLDVNMPGMDGFETAAMIRQRQRSEHTPIILLTAMSDTETHVSRGYSLGVVDYIHTPFLPEVLKAKVSVFVELFRKTEQERRHAAQLLLAEQRRAAQLRKLSSASLAINTTSSIDSLLQAVADQARSMIGTHQALSAMAAGGALARVTKAMSSSEQEPPSPLLCARAIELNGPLRIARSEVQAQTSYPDEIQALLRAKGWLSAPLTRRDGMNMGLIQLSDKASGDFTDEDEALLVQLAEIASIALEKTLYQEAQEANRLKDEFLATLSHELRNPLNAMLGWTRLLRTGQLDAANSAKAIDVIERNVELQAKLIEDLLDVSRSIAGKVQLSVSPLQLRPVVEASVDALRPAAEEKRLRLELDLEPEAAASRVSGDPDRLGQVAWNLLSNAIKFTPQGGTVRIELRRLPAQVELSVSDTGEGISPEVLPYVFERFRQGDTSITRTHGGLGLGLAIVRHLVELHRGTVQAESQGKGHGATFRVRLPCLDRQERAAETQSGREAGSRATGDHPLDGLRVLVVEDDVDTRDLIATTLEGCGARVDRASSAREALEALDRFHPDVLVSDISMPHEDGYSLVRAVRARRPEMGGAVPALALTTLTQADERIDALLAGFQMHMAKPFEPAKLVAAVERLAKGSSLDLHTG